MSARPSDGSGNSGVPARDVGGGVFRVRGNIPGRGSAPRALRAAGRSMKSRLKRATSTRRAATPSRRRAPRRGDRRPPIRAASTGSRAVVLDEFPGAAGCRTRGRRRCRPRSGRSRCGPAASPAGSVLTWCWCRASEPSVGLPAAAPGRPSRSSCGPCPSPRALGPRRPGNRRSAGGRSRCPASCCFSSSVVTFAQGAHPGNRPRTIGALPVQSSTAS